MHITIIDKIDVTRDYGMPGTAAIIDHPAHGRMMLCDGFGGLDTLQGGAVRWRHGVAIKLQPADTFASLATTPWNDWMPLLQAVKSGYDDTRPVLDWRGDAVAATAASAGLS